MHVLYVCSVVFIRIEREEGFREGRGRAESGEGRGLSSDNVVVETVLNYSCQLSQRSITLSLSLT